MPSRRPASPAPAACQAAMSATPGRPAQSACSARVNSRRLLYRRACRIRSSAANGGILNPCHNACQIARESRTFFSRMTSICRNVRASMYRCPIAASSPASELFSSPCSSASARAQLRELIASVSSYSDRCFAASTIVSTSPNVICASSQRVEQQLLQFRRDQHHVSAERIHQLARCVRLDAGFRRLRRGYGPPHRVFLAHARQFHHPAVLAQRFSDPLKSILVVHLHAPIVRRDAQEISHKNHQCLRVGRFEIAVQRRKLILLRAPRIKLPDVPHKNHLERRHQRRSLRPIENIEDGGSTQIEVGETKIPEVCRNKAPSAQPRGSGPAEIIRRPPARIRRATALSLPLQPGSQ